MHNMNDRWREILSKKCTTKKEFFRAAAAAVISQMNRSHQTNLYAVERSDQSIIFYIQIQLYGYAERSNPGYSV